jgi:2-isopropylmalate synthase
MNLTPTRTALRRPQRLLDKGGLHVEGIARDPATYEHVTPEAVGNVRRMPVGELSGKNSIRQKAEEMALKPGHYGDSYSYKAAGV